MSTSLFRRRRRLVLGVLASCAALAGLCVGHPAALASGWAGVALGALVCCALALARPLRALTLGQARRRCVAGGLMLALVAVLALVPQRDVPVFVAPVGYLAALVVAWALAWRHASRGGLTDAQAGLV